MCQIPNCPRPITHYPGKNLCDPCYHKDNKRRRKLANRERELALHKVRSDRYRVKHPRKGKNYHRLKRYGLSPERYDKMFVEQAGKCRICLRTFVGLPHIDHDHNTGKVRGLLCRWCNSGIGFLLENEFIFGRAVAYLKHWGSMPLNHETGVLRHVDLPLPQLMKSPKERV